MESHPSPQVMHPVPLKGCGHLPTAQAVAECQNLEEAVILERIPKEVIKQLLLAGSTSSAVSSSHRTEWELLLISQSTGLARLLQILSCSLSSVCTCFPSPDLICKQKWPLKCAEADTENFNTTETL